MFFFILLMISILILIAILFLKIQIHIENLKYYSIKTEGNNLNKNYNIKINIYTFKNIKLFELNINRESLRKTKIKDNINKLEERIAREKNKIDISLIKKIKYLNIKLKIINLKLEVGVADASQTAILVGIFSAVISLFLKTIKQEENKWKIKPIYENKNLFKIELDCIICIKMIHIIYTIYAIKKEGEKKNGQPSNRRNYAYNNE